MNPRGTGRGPAGAAPLPPRWLSTATLPISTIRAGTTLHRVHQTRHDAVFFGPGADKAGKPRAPLFRFDSASGAFGVLYAAEQLAGSLVETLLRNPERRMVPLRRILLRSATALECARDLRLVRLHGSGLQRVGTDNAISTGPYEPCALWADALWHHRSRPDGIEYQSRHDPSQLCWAIFERPGLRFVPRSTTSLSSMLAEVRTVLQAYGKSVSP